MEADSDAGRRAGPTATEREGLAELRREASRLDEDMEILKRATALYAAETP